ncbi:MAG: hypothetical protein JRE63_09815 [Deltaproteobacteria bacterium]|jgi:outer membrane lipopolysaccharide assembly protein LptE/RlpB|nr:hypothetical protein [Deltaproteobacteria bacterium]
MNWKLLIAISAVICLTGCGYHTPNRSDSWVGGNANTLFVDLFANRSTEPYLENYLTDQVVLQMSRTRMVELTERQDLADLVLTGTIDSFSADAIAYDAGDRITEYSARMSVLVKLVNRDDGQVLWQKRLSRSERFGAFVNKTLQLEGQDLAAREVAKRLAEDLYANLFNSF